MYFSQKTLSKILKDSGFNKVETRKTYHVLSLEYIFNRLMYYSPGIFGFLLGLIRKTPLRNFSFKAYTGEIEGWGQK
jgi:hypothetical protein